MISALGSLERKLPRGVKAVGIFLLFAALMALIAGIALIWPGTILDRMWLLNPSAHQQLAPFGKTVGIPFLLLSVVLCSATVGWFNRRRWGWQLTVFIIATQVLGDLVNVLLGRVIEGGVGVAIAGALLLYLLRANVKSVFETNTLPE
jgi:hypothetical protein